LSSLQISLLILAVALVVAVVGYNYWQNRKVAMRIEQSRAGMARSVHAERQAQSKSHSLGESSVAQRRAEPGFGELPSVQDSPALSAAGSASTHQGAEQSPPTRAQTEPMAVKLSAEQEHTPVAQSDPYMLRTFGLHPLADCVIDIAFEQPIPSERLMNLIGSVRRVGAKPVLFEGIAQDGETEPFVAGERFHGIRMGVLMANRHGPLNAMEYSDFAALAQKVADGTESKLTLPEMNDVLNRARALDARCAELDAQIGLNVLTPEALSPVELAAAARELGLVERGNHRFAKLTEHGDVLYSFSLADSLNRITLLLDVPRAPTAANPWAQMLDCAKRAVARFGGRMVDDLDKPLSAEALDRIGSQLNQRYQSLADASFAAGSPVALRLFN
jgi:hypothetical protein